jgi:hypothetical protein
MSTEHPILFNAAMVRANLAGAKTQTRRLVTQRNSTVNGYPFDKHCAWPWHMLEWDKAEFCTTSIHSDNDPHFSVPLMGEDGKPETDPDNVTRHRVRPRWSVGDTLWGKETFKENYVGNVMATMLKAAEQPTVYYRATHEGPVAWNWRPSIFMRRQHARILRQITEIRGQRLQEISEGDAIEEGITFEGTDHDYIRIYRDLWDSINAKKAPWASNPPVWAITYKPIQP